MSCKIGNLPVSAIKFGSQNITKVMQDGNVLWQGIKPTVGGRWVGQIWREDVFYCEYFDDQCWEVLFSGYNEVLKFQYGEWCVAGETIQTGDGSEKTLVNEEMGINLVWEE